MRRFLKALSLLLLIAPSIFAQPPYPSCCRSLHEEYQTLDSVRYVVSYNYSTYRDPEHPEQRDNDEVWLEIGDSVTKQYSRPRWVNDSIVGVVLGSGAEAYSPLSGWCMHEEIYFGIPQNHITWTYIDLLYETKYAWREKIPTQEWNLEEGAKEVIGYRCKKATVDFRGRHYTAWYAPDIPLPYGPWSFHGLPGLILEIEDDTNRVSFVANWFSKAHSDYPLALYDDYYEKVSRKKARKIIELMHKHPYIHVGEGIKNMRWLRENPKTEWKHTWVELE